MWVHKGGLVPAEHNGNSQNPDLNGVSEWENKRKATNGIIDNNLGSPAVPSRDTNNKSVARLSLESPLRSGDDDDDGDADDDFDDDDGDDIHGGDGDVEFSDSLANHIQERLANIRPPSLHTFPSSGVSYYNTPLSPNHMPLMSPPTDTTPSENDDGDIGGCGSGGGGSRNGRRGDVNSSVALDYGGGTSTSAGGVSLSDDASILSLSDSNLLKSSPSSDILPHADVVPHHGEADRDHDLDEGDLDPEPSHSLSIYESAESRTSISDAAPLLALPSDPASSFSNPTHPGFENKGGGEIREASLPVSTRNTVLLPDASG